MSGGVDSAVALLRAGPARDRRDAAALARPGGARRRARLLLAGGRARGARDVPRARAPARHARPARGVPRARSSSRSSTATPAGRRRTRASAATAAFASRAARVRRARRRGAARDRPLRAHRRARGPAAPRPRRRPAKDQSYMLAPARPGVLEPDLVPARRADEGRDARRGGARRARGGAPRREPGGVLPRRRRLPRVPRAARPGGRARARSSTRTGASSAATTASGASRPASAEGSASRPASPLYALRSEPQTNTVVVGPLAALAATEVDGSRTPARPGHAGRREAPLPLAGGRRPTSRRPTAASASGSTSPPTASPPGQTAVLYDRRRVVGAGRSSTPAETRGRSSVCTEGRMRRRDHARRSRASARFHGVAHLVLGGLGRPPQPDDRAPRGPQLALDALLERDAGGRRRDGRAAASTTARSRPSVGPFEPTALRAELERGRRRARPAP